jgi:hypothetical protein
MKEKRNIINVAANYISKGKNNFLSGVGGKHSSICFNSIVISTEDNL